MEAIRDDFVYEKATKMNKIKRFVKELWGKIRNGFFQIVGANLINKIVAVLSNMVITRVLSTTDYGAWSYVLNQYTYFSIVSALGLLSGAFQFGAENRGNEKEFAYYKYCLRIGLFINLGLVCIGFLRVFFFEPAIAGTGIFLLIYIPVLILEYIMNILTTILRCEDRIKEYARVLNVNTLLMGIGTCGGAFFGIIGVIIGKYISFIICLIVLFFIMKREISSIRLNDAILLKNELKELWHFSIMSCVSSAMNSLLYLLDVTMVASLMKDADQTAIYKVATYAPNALSFIPASVVIFILPNLIAHNKDKQWLKTNVKKTYFLMGGTNVLITTVIILLAPIIILILSGGKYLSAVPMFRILMLGYCISASFRTLSANILFGLKKININMLINLVASLADIGLNFFLITRYGAYGAAIATVLSETIASVIAFSYTINLIYKKEEFS